MMEPKLPRLLSPAELSAIAERDRVASHAHNGTWTTKAVQDRRDLLQHVRALEQELAQLRGQAAKGAIA